MTETNPISRINMDFARRDDCLDRMVPSDLRTLVGQRDAAVELLREARAQLIILRNNLDPECGDCGGDSTSTGRKHRPGCLISRIGHLMAEHGL